MACSKDVSFLDFCCFVLQGSTFGCFKNCGIVNPRSLESLKKEQLSPVVLPKAGSIGTGVRGFGMRSADLKLRSAIPICAAISQPASGNGIISVRQGRVGPPLLASTSSFPGARPEVNTWEALGGLYGDKGMRRVIGGEIGAGQPHLRGGKDILAPQLYPKGHEQISEKHEC